MNSGASSDSNEISLGVNSIRGVGIPLVNSSHGSAHLAILESNTASYISPAATFINGASGGAGVHIKAGNGASNPVCLGGANDRKACQCPGGACVNHMSNGGVACDVSRDCPEGVCEYVHYPMLDVHTRHGASRFLVRGDGSIAAGFRAKVRDAPGGGNTTGDHGTFVWADSTSADFTSLAPDQFLVRARGGIWFGTTSAPSIPAERFLNTSTGGYLSTAGIWIDSSDRDAKDNFAPVHHREILKRLAEVPLARWDFKVQDDSVQHIGPTAQDVHAAFGAGEDEKHLASLDTSGVALAAIQGLYRTIQERGSKIEALEKRLSKLEALLDDATLLNREER